MGWQDRNYSPGRENANAYFSNPALALQYAFPLYTSRSLTIRLHFWFLLYALFDIIGIVHVGLPLFYIPIHLALMLGAVLFHELGHRLFARSVGGDHWEWVVWPLGGMNPPAVSNAPRPMFIANIGGNVFTIVLGAMALGGLIATRESWSWLSGYSPMAPIVFLTGGAPTAAIAILAHCLAFIASLCAAIFVVNLFPCYWFDGGYLWQATQAPWRGAWKSATFTCIAGMVLSVPCFLHSLWNQDFFGVILWALIFADCFNRRRALLAAGPGVLDADDESYLYQNTVEPVRKKVRPGVIKAAKKRRAAEAQEQAQIDAILAKVHAQGLHSLSWSEKRALKKATDRQRKRDLANRP